MHSGIKSDTRLLKLKVDEICFYCTCVIMREMTLQLQFLINTSLLKVRAELSQSCLSAQYSCKRQLQSVRPVI